MGVGRRIRFLRKKANLTQFEVAQRANLNSVAVSRIELKESNPKYQTMQRLADAIGVPLAHFFLDDEMCEVVCFLTGRLRLPQVENERARL